MKSIPAAVAKSFSNASSFEAFIVPNAGHGLNLEYSAAFTYSTINKYLAQHGLKA
jgi:pimeloyl-ACP methyl ester carboxylesterase